MGEVPLYHTSGPVACTPSNLSTCVKYLQGHLTHKKHPPPRTLW